MASFSHKGNSCGTLFRQGTYCRSVAFTWLKFRKFHKWKGIHKSLVRTSLLDMVIPILSKHRSSVVCCSTSNSPLLNRLGCSLSFEMAAMCKGKKALQQSCEHMSHLIVAIQALGARSITVRSMIHKTKPPPKKNFKVVIYKTWSTCKFQLLQYSSIYPTMKLPWDTLQVFRFWVDCSWAAGGVYKQTYSALLNYRNTVDCMLHSHHSILNVSHTHSEFLTTECIFLQDSHSQSRKAPYIRPVHAYPITACCTNNWLLPCNTDILKLPLSGHLGTGHCP